jgi:hypothetical protein
MAATKNNMNVVSVAGLIRQLGIAYKTKCTMVVQSKPGCGKTEIITKAGASLVPSTGTVWYFNAALKSQEWVGGIMFPAEANTRCKLLTSDHWGLVQDGDIVILDEMDKVDHRVQNMYLETSQFKSIDGKKLGATGDVLFVVCANKSEHKAGSYDISPLFGNRSKCLEFQPSPEEVLLHFSTIGVHHFIMTYLSENRGDINPSYNPTELRNASSRSWVNASKELYAFGEGISYADTVVTVAGYVPDGIAHKVAVYHELAGQLVPVEEIFKDPKTARIPGDKGSDSRGIKFMQLHMTAAAAMAIESDGKRAKAKTSLWQYAKRFPAEFRAAIMPVMTQAPIPAAMIDDDEFSTWIKERTRIMKEGK